jgi:hypothetical protein
LAKPRMSPPGSGLRPSPLGRETPARSARSSISPPYPRRGCVLIRGTGSPGEFVTWKAKRRQGGSQGLGRLPPGAEVDFALPPPRKEILGKMSRIALQGRANARRACSRPPPSHRGQLARAGLGRIGKGMGGKQAIRPRVLMASPERTNGR